MIGPGGTFDYEAVLSRRPGGVWRGIAAPSPTEGGHPGQAGRQPIVDLCEDRVTLRRSEPRAARLNEHYQRWGQPASRISFAVGPIVSAVVADGDVLRVARHGGGELTVTLMRERSCLLLLGAAVERLWPEILIEDAPSRDQLLGSEAAELLDAPDTLFVWLDASDSEVERHLDAMLEQRDAHLVVALAAPDQDSGSRLAWRLLERTVGVLSSMSSFDVPDHIATPDEWLAYVRQPVVSLADAVVRFTMNGGTTELRVGDSAWVEPWHLHVARFLQMGDPGRDSSVGVALAHPAVTTEMLVASSLAVASTPLDAGWDHVSPARDAKS